MTIYHATSVAFWLAFVVLFGAGCYRAFNQTADEREDQ